MFDLFALMLLVLAIIHIFFFLLSIWLINKGNSKKFNEWAGHQKLFRGFDTKNFSELKYKFLTALGPALIFIWLLKNYLK